MILVISDIHLGAPVCQAELTLKLLEEEEYDTLIICGDLLDSYHLHRLCKKQWKVLSTLRKISKNKECIFIKGNHDQHIETITALLGFEFYEEFIKTIGDKKILFVHGDRWDHFVMAKPILTSIASFFYHLLQLFDSKQKLSRKLKRIIKTWHNSADTLMERISKYCVEHKYNAVCFGHSHIPKKHFYHGIECVNLGSQCDLPVTYAVIDHIGNIILKNKDY
jgi:predicted phosphodiesterase